ncbi:MAG: hypothetical protein K2X87_20800 [Gemmataceae bacterium]|nr:hypothetical protein [Gemmataceae bacterium]
MPDDQVLNQKIAAYKNEVAPDQLVAHQEAAFALLDACDDSFELARLALETAIQLKQQAQGPNHQG